MNKLRDLFSDTLIYGISSVFARFINYLLVPLYTGVFRAEEYGIVGLVYAAIALLNILFTMGMESAYLRYAKNREQSANLFKTLQLFLVGSSVLLVGVLWLLAPFITPELGIETKQDIYWLMLGILFCDTLAIVSFAELRFVRKATTFAVLKIINVAINLGLNFVLILGFRFGIEAVFISNFVGSLFTAICIWGVTLQELKGAWNTTSLRMALQFGLPFVPAGIGHVINEMLDRFFIKSMSVSDIEHIYGEGVSAEYLVGIYNANYKLAVFMLLLVQMFRMAWQPYFMRTSDDEEAPQLFAKTFSAFNVAAATILLLVGLFVEQIVAINIPFLNTTLIGEEYWAGLSIVPILLFAYWFQGWYVNFSAGIFIKNKTKKLAQITLIGAFVTIVANIVLIPSYGILGSAIATVISYFVMAMIIYGYSTRAFSVPYNMLRAMAVLLISGLVLYAQSVVVVPHVSEVVVSVVLLVGGVFLIAMISYKDVFGKA